MPYNKAVGAAGAAAVPLQKLPPAATAEAAGTAAAAIPSTGNPIVDMLVKALQAMQTPAAATAGAAGAAGATAAAGATPAAAAPPQIANETVEDAQRYIDSIDQNGNINEDKITNNKKIPISNAQVDIIANYAGEFTRGIAGRATDATKLAAATNSVINDLAGPDGPKKDAATFRLVAATYKNGGQNYNNGNLKKVLEKGTKNDDLASGGGVGDKDVETLAAVSRAIERGTLQLSDVFDDDGKDINGNKSVDNTDEYNKAIDYVAGGGFLNDFNAAHSGGVAAGNPLRTKGEREVVPGTIPLITQPDPAAAAATPAVATPAVNAATAPSITTTPGTTLPTGITTGTASPTLAALLQEFMKDIAMMGFGQTNGASTGGLLGGTPTLFGAQGSPSNSAMPFTMATNFATPAGQNLSAGAQFQQMIPGGLGSTQSAGSFFGSSIGQQSVVGGDGSSLFGAGNNLFGIPGLGTSANVGQPLVIQGATLDQVQAAANDPTHKFAITLTQMS